MPKVLIEIPAAILIKLAMEIADEQSASIIECNGIPVRSKSGALLWYEIDRGDPYCGWEITRAIRYLKMRNKLRVRKSNPNHVKAVL